MRTGGTCFGAIVLHADGGYASSTPRFGARAGVRRGGRAAYRNLTTATTKPTMAPVCIHNAR